MAKLIDNSTAYNRTSEVTEREREIEGERERETVGASKCSSKVNKIISIPQVSLLVIRVSVESRIGVVEGREKQMRDQKTISQCPVKSISFFPMQFVQGIKSYTTFTTTATGTTTTEDGKRLTFFMQSSSYANIHQIWQLVGESFQVSLLNLGRLGGEIVGQEFTWCTFLRPAR